MCGLGVFTGVLATQRAVPGRWGITGQPTRDAGRAAAGGLLGCAWVWCMCISTTPHTITTWADFAYGGPGPTYGTWCEVVVPLPRSYDTVLSCYLMPLPVRPRRTQVYVNLSDADIPHQAEYYAEAVWKCVCPEGDAIVPEVRCSQLCSLHNTGTGHVLL